MFAWKFGYELYGSPSSRRGDDYVQALVKSDDGPVTDVASTLAALHGRRAQPS